MNINLTTQVKSLKNQLSTERKYLDVLTQDYAAVYHVNLRQDTSKLVKVDSQIAGYDAVKVSLRQTNKFSERVEAYSNKFVVPSLREEFKKMLTSENIRKELEQSPRFVYRYKTLKLKQGQQYFEMYALRMSHTLEDDNVLIAFRHIDDVVTTEQRHQLELEERVEQERNQNEVLSALGRNYHAIFRIDLEDDSYIEVVCRDEVRHYYNSSMPSASRVLEEVCEKIVDDKFYKHMRRFFDLNTIAKRLQNREFVETECVTKEGNWHRARLIAKRRDEDGVVTHILYVTQLIDDEKQYEEHLIAKAEFADYANRAKSDFVSQVAHDIRTPMNSIFGFLEIAEANIGDWEKVKYSLERIRAASEFLNALANDVLDISRMERGIIKLNPVAFHLETLLQELIETMEITKKSKHQNFCFDLQNMTRKYIVADPLRIKQIYANVLSNAMKYTPNEGSVTFLVRQEELPDENKVRLVATISDTGIGMSEEFMAKMFLKFEREVDTRVNEVNGYGLGLSIVKQLVELMDGTKEIESKIQEGTTVRIMLDVPYLKEEVHPVQDTKDDGQIECAGMHLLVAEDNELNREVITELLFMHGITCDCAEDGEICVKMLLKAKEDTYDAILMDMQMPNMNGVEATKMIRSLSFEKAKNIPIVAMTANALKEDVEKCLSVGMNRHLSKPVDMGQLLKTLTEILKK